MLKRIVFFILLLIILTAVYAQKDKNNIRSDFVVKPEKKWMLKSNFQVHSLNLSITDNEKIGKDIQYQPNVKLKWGVEAAYKGLLLGASIKLPHDDEQLDRKGKSEYLDYRIYGSMKRFGFDVFYQRYTGFFISNPKNFDINWAAPKPYPQNNDLQLSTLGFNFFFIFSKKFSLKAAIQQTERQIQSAGSFLIMLSYAHLRINTQKSLIPATETGDYPLLADFKTGNFGNITIAPGYAYSFVYKDLYFTPAIFLGAGRQKQKNIQSQTENTKKVPIGKVNIRLLTGYNGPKYLFGIILVQDYAFISLYEDQILFNTAQFKIFAGFRF